MPNLFQGELRHQEVTGKRGEIVVYPNVGQELFDVVTITDGRAGLEATLWRVMGLVEEYDPQKGVYGQTLDLGER